MLFKTLLLTFGSFLIVNFINAQEPTVGLIYNSGNATEGYTLYTPEGNNTSVLINNCGELINEWQFNENPGLTCYILENGNILRAGQDSLQIRDWNNNVIWTYAMDDNNLPQHHDI